MRRGLRGALLTGTALTGILGAHALDYLLVVPDPSDRHDLLLRTGHGYLARALEFTLAIVIFAVCTAVALGFARHRTGRRAPGFGATACTLALVQSGGFIVLEATERLLVRVPADRTALLIGCIGVLVQIIVAIGAASILRLLDRAGVAIARALLRPRSWGGRTLLRVRCARASRARQFLRPVALLGRGPPPPCIR